MDTTPTCLRNSTPRLLIITIREMEEVNANERNKATVELAKKAFTIQIPSKIIATINQMTEKD